MGTGVFRVVTLAKRTVLVPVKWALAFAERLCMHFMRPSDIPFPPIFVIGPPRSGTTLVSQLMAATFRLGRLTNVMGRFYLAPYLVGLVTYPFLNFKASDDFKSSYGRTLTLAGPHEGGQFWRRWFGGRLAMTLIGGTSGSGALNMRREVAAMTKLYRAPMMFKNTFNSWRIVPLATVFPEALFVQVCRDVVPMARSILRGRIDLYGSKDAWMGVEPKGIEALRKRPYWEQVVEQVILTQEKIQRDRRLVGETRFISVSYEDVCAAPAREMNRIRAFVEAHGCRLATVGKPPPSLQKSSDKKISPVDSRRIEEYAAVCCRRSERSR